MASTHLPLWEKLQRQNRKPVIEHLEEVTKDLNMEVTEVGRRLTECDAELASFREKIAIQGQEILSLKTELSLKDAISPYVGTSFVVVFNTWPWIRANDQLWPERVFEFAKTIACCIPARVKQVRVGVCLSLDLYDPIHIDCLKEQLGPMLSATSIVPDRPPSAPITWRIGVDGGLSLVDVTFDLNGSFATRVVRNV